MYAGGRDRWVGGEELLGLTWPLILHHMFGNSIVNTIRQSLHCVISLSISNFLQSSHPHRYPRGGWPPMKCLHDREAVTRGVGTETFDD